MSDLQPRGIKTEIGGQEYHFLFTLNNIDKIQERCNLPLTDAVKKVGEVIDGNAQDHEAVAVFKEMLSVLMSSGEHTVTAEEAGDMLTLFDYKAAAWKILEAYGVSIPDPDEEDEDEDEEEKEDPNVQTGR